jgi:hypothetical protein
MRGSPLVSDTKILWFCVLVDQSRCLKLQTAHGTDLMEVP